MLAAEDRWVGHGHGHGEDDPGRWKFKNAWGTTICLLWCQ